MEDLNAFGVTKLGGDTHRCVIFVSGLVTSTPKDERELMRLVWPLNVAI